MATASNPTTTTMMTDAAPDGLVGMRNKMPAARPISPHEATQNSGFSTAAWT